MTGSKRSPGSGREVQFNHRCLPVEEWPAPDRDAWAKAIAPDDLLDPGGLGGHWSLASRRKTSKGYGRFLAWLEQMGLLDPSCSPADRVTPELATAYVEHLFASNRGYTVLCRAQELYDAIRVMAPDRDWTWLRKLGSAIRSRTTPARNKEGLIQSPAALADLGAKLMTQAESDANLTLLQRAVRYRDGLMIAFLAYLSIGAQL